MKSLALGITLVALVGTVAMLAALVRRPTEHLRRDVCAGMSVLLVEFAVLIAIGASSSVVGVVTEVLFLAGAVWFFVLERRFRRQAQG